MAENDGMTMGYLMGQSDNRSGNGGGFGGMFGEGLWAIIILAMLGFGRGGFGGFGGGGSNGFGGGFMATAPWATQADVRAAVDQQTLISKLDQQTYGISDLGYALNSTITNGFHGVDNAICNLGFNMQQGFNTLGYQAKDCCCETQRLMERGFCDLGQAISMQTRDIIDNQNCNYRGLMDFIVNEKLANKDARIAQLEGQVGRAEQNSIIGARIDAAVADVLRRTGNDCPTAAYLVQPPTAINFPTNGCGQVQFGYNNGRDGWNWGRNSDGCGCGSCC